MARAGGTYRGVFPSSRVEVVILSVAPSGAVIPRRMRLDVEPGEGRLHFSSTPAMDDACRASLRHAWTAALDLAERSDLDGRVSFAGATAIHGGSAGLSLGLAALARLLDAPLPPHFATGTLTEDGMIVGGIATGVKATAAAHYAPQMGLAHAVFLSPPIPDPPTLPGLPIVLAADLGSAFARLAPDAYRRVAARHRLLRDAGTESRAPFTRLHNGWITLGENGLVLWRTPLGGPAGAEPETLHALARRSSILAPATVASWGGGTGS